MEFQQLGDAYNVPSIYKRQTSDVHQATRRRLRNPCSARGRASLATSSISKVTCGIASIAFSRTNPQYKQELIHFLEEGKGGVDKLYTHGLSKSGDGSE
jgi:hypothetical protein